MRELIVALFSFLILGYLLYVGCKEKNGYIATMYISTLLILSAFYLLQFGNLQTFSVKALSTEANFIRATKVEVEHDAAAIQKIKEQMGAIFNQINKDREETQKSKQRIVAFEKKLLETRAMASPPTLSLNAKKLLRTKGNDDLNIVRLPFIPSKREPLGILSFEARIVAGNAKLIDIAATDMTGIQYGGHNHSVSDDGLNGSIKNLSLEAFGIDEPIISITVKGNGRISIKGNRLNSPVVVDIE